MRAKRMQSMLCKGWIEGSGSSSAKAGMNGGFDVLCGRLVYYDHSPADREKEGRGRCRSADDRAAVVSAIRALVR